jgi:hypothetical protein
MQADHSTKLLLISALYYIKIAIKVDFFITHSAATITTFLIGGDGYHDVTKFLKAHIDLWLP